MHKEGRIGMLIVKKEKLFNRDDDFKKIVIAIASI